MGTYSCGICKDKAACRAVDEELAKGATGEFVARLMTLRGWPTTAPTVNGHRKHAVGAADGVIAAKTQRDLARVVRDKALELFDNGDLALTDREHVPGITAGLKAQAELNKQANKSDDRKTGIAIAMILSGATSGGPPEHLLIGDGNVIDGEYEDLSLDPAAADED